MSRKGVFIAAGILLAVVIIIVLFIVIAPFKETGEEIPLVVTPTEGVKVSELDEDAEAFKFLKPDTMIVTAVDVDRLRTYAWEAGADLRKADVAHFVQGLESISNNVARHNPGFPDISTVLDSLSGVQVLSFNSIRVDDEPEWLLVLTAKSDDDLKKLTAYTATAFVEDDYRDTIHQITEALNDYYDGTRQYGANDQPAEPNVWQEGVEWEELEEWEPILDEPVPDDPPAEDEDWGWDEEVTEEPDWDEDDWDGVEDDASWETEDASESTGIINASYRNAQWGRPRRDDGPSPGPERAQTDIDGYYEERVRNDSYPESLDQLVDEGYLDYLPINPFTGDRIRIVSDIEDAELGDIYYEAFRDNPRWGYGYDRAGDGNGYDPDALRYFELATSHLGGTITHNGNEGSSYTWYGEYEPFDDLEDRLLGFQRAYNLDEMGFDIETEGSWLLFEREQDYYNIAFAYGDNFLIIGSDIHELKDAIERYENGEGYQFDAPGDFETDGAFIRGQADVAGFWAEMVDQFYEGELELFEDYMGIDSMTTLHGACLISAGQIEFVYNLELDGTAEDSILGALLTIPDDDLKTAEGGPFEILAELAMANPDDYAVAGLYMFDEFYDPYYENWVIDMIIDALEELDFGDELYAVVTGSRERDDGKWLPGLVVMLKTDDEELSGWMKVFVERYALDTQDFPLEEEDFGDDDAVTWVLDHESDGYYDPSVYITPTVAWSDEWVVIAEYREDAITARDALIDGTMLASDELDSAKLRMKIKYHDGLAGAADFMYMFSDTRYASGALGGAAALRMLSGMCGMDDAAVLEVSGSGDSVDVRMSYSIDILEEYMPALIDLMAAIGSM